MSDVRMDLGAPFYPAMLGWAGQSHGRVSLIETEQVHNVSTNKQKPYQSRQEGLNTLKCVLNKHRSEKWKNDGKGGRLY